MKNSKLKTVCFTVFTWIVILAGINFACGLIVQNTYIAVDPIDKKEAEATYGYFAPRQDKVILFPGLKPYKVKINSLGLRTVGLPDDLTLEHIQEKYRILVLGDSVSFGLFVDDQDSYPYRLQNILTKNKKDAVVLNAGVGGATVPDYLYYLKEKGLKLKPDLVAINFCSNDLGELSRKTPLYKKMKDENVFSLFKTIKLANFMRIFRKFELARRYKRSTNRIQDEKVREILFNESKDLEDILRVAAFHGGPTVTDPRSQELKEMWTIYFDTLDEITDLLRKENIDFLYIIHPDIVTVYDRSNGRYQDILKDYLERKGIEYIDLLPNFKKRRDEHLSLYNNLPRDFHLSGNGNQILAEEFYQRLTTRLN